MAEVDANASSGVSHLESFHRRLLSESPGQRSKLGGNLDFGVGLTLEVPDESLRLSQTIHLCKHQISHLGHLIRNDALLHPRLPKPSGCPLTCRDVTAGNGLKLSIIC